MDGDQEKGTKLFTFPYGRAAGRRGANTSSRVSEDNKIEIFWRTKQ